MISMTIIVTQFLHWYLAARFVPSKYVVPAAVPALMTPSRYNVSPEQFVFIGDSYIKNRWLIYQSCRYSNPQIFTSGLGPSTSGNERELVHLEHRFSIKNSFPMDRQPAPANNSESRTGSVDRRQF